MTIKVKICGLKTREDVEVADNNGADFIGFVFCEKSPRNITPIDAGKISHSVKAKKVAVVVDASDELLAEIMEHLKPDYIQLHGEHDIGVRAIGIKNKFKLPLIRAATPDNYPTRTQIEMLYEFLLIDSPNGGGSGKPFNWRNFTPPHDKGWFLSGGLNAQNVAEAVKATGAKMVDISSGVESSKGVKDLAKIKEFLEFVRCL